MEHLRVRSGLTEHPKWEATSDRGRSVLIELWCYCARAENDGHVTPAAARRCGLTGRTAEQLEALQWVHRNGDGGWVLHDWLDHQVSKAELEAAREKASRRSKRYRQKGAGDA